MRRCGVGFLPETRNFLRPSISALSLPNPNHRIIVPLIFHVIGNSTVQNAITESRINAQVKQLNQDFSMTNQDSNQVPVPFRPWQATTAKISFELKQINRRTTSQSFAVSSDSLKNLNPCQDRIKSSSLGGASAINTAINCNIWVADIGEELLGYAQVPWVRAEGGCYLNSDGVVVHYGTLGSISSPNPSVPYMVGGIFNLGRTMTHEVGHYLGLAHIWDDCEETECCRALPDLPAQKGSNAGRPTFPHRANSCLGTFGAPSPQHGDMFMNYMDYVYDDSMYMFSESQIQSCIDYCISYRPNMIRQFNSASSSTLDLTGLKSTNNSDTYQCIVSTADGTTVESEKVTITTITTA